MVKINPRFEPWVSCKWTNITTVLTVSEKTDKRVNGK